MSGQFASRGSRFALTLVATLVAACTDSVDTAPAAPETSRESASSPVAPTEAAAEVATRGSIPPPPIVADLSFDAYKRTIATLAGFGDRRAGSDSYDEAARWVEDMLAEAGYAIEHHEFTSSYPFTTRTATTLRSTYVTKVGMTSPDEMYLISAHLDGMGGGGAADDDASGSALVLLAALAFAPAAVATEQSIRFVFWNGEERGLQGSRAYVDDRVDLQGIESPPGSGLYPEPHWLGIIQHDMLLFDHGFRPGVGPEPPADIDIEFQQDAALADESRALAELWIEGNAAYSSDFPAEIGPNMRATDSYSFIDFAPAISVRENQRVAEIGRGSNPHWHQPSDVYATYSEADFRLGFNALQMTVGSVASLVNAR